MDLVNTLILSLYFLASMIIALIIKPVSFEMKNRYFLMIIFLSKICSEIIKMPILNHYKIIVTICFIVIIYYAIIYKNMSLAIKITLANTLFFILGEALVGILFVQSLNMHKSYIQSMMQTLLLFNGCIIVVAITLSIIFNRLIKMTSHLPFSKNKINNIAFNSILSCSVIFFYFYMYSNYKEDAYLIILSITTTYLFLLLLLMNKNNILRYKDNEYKTLQLYTNVIENLLSDVNTFRHDYRNMLATIDGYLENDDLNGLKQYSQDNNRISNYLNVEIASLKNIKESGIKGLLAIQITKMYTDDIKVYLEVLDEINTFEINTFDLSRILGILLDNAYEAAKNSLNKTVYIHFIQDSCLNITISNSFDKTPCLEKIYQKGFSTKGKNRGLGLFTVNHILHKKYNNISLQTSIKDGLFIQELFIFNHE